MMKDYTIKELKTAFAVLYTTDCDSIWQAISRELARRLDGDEYAEFVETVQNGHYLVVNCMA